MRWAAVWLAWARAWAAAASFCSAWARLAQRSLLPVGHDGETQDTVLTIHIDRQKRGFGGAPSGNGGVFGLDLRREAH